MAVPSVDGNVSGVLPEGGAAVYDRHIRLHIEMRLQAVARADLPSTLLDTFAGSDLSI